MGNLTNNQKEMMYIVTQTLRGTRLLYKTQVRIDNWCADDYIHMAIEILKKEED